jgi:hypothetical protein
MGIISSGALRFGNARFLNDQTEFVYGWNIVEDVINRGIEDNLELSLMVEEARQILSAESVSHEVYLCSLSERPDLLSQWERYGDKGNGYCLGFRKREITAPQLIGSGVSLCKIIYDLAAQRQAAEACILDRKTFLQLTADFAGAKIDTSPVMSAKSLASDLRQVALRLKNPSFEDEAEWRLVFMIDAANEREQPPSFMTRGNYVASYVDVAISTSSVLSSTLPLTTIICGPKLDAAFARASVQYLLRVYGYDDVEIITSKLLKVWR